VIEPVARIDDVRHTVPALGPADIENHRAEEFYEVRKKDDERHEPLERELARPPLLGALRDRARGTEPEGRAQNAREQRPEDDHTQRPDLDPREDDDLPEAREPLARRAYDEPRLADRRDGRKNRVEPADRLVLGRRSWELEPDGADRDEPEERAHEHNARRDVPLDEPEIKPEQMDRCEPGAHKRRGLPVHKAHREPDEDQDLLGACDLEERRPARTGPADIDDETQRVKAEEPELDPPEQIEINERIVPPELQDRGDIREQGDAAPPRRIEPGFRDGPLRDASDRLHSGARVSDAAQSRRRKQKFPRDHELEKSTDRQESSGEPDPHWEKHGDFARETCLPKEEHKRDGEDRKARTLKHIEPVMPHPIHGRPGREQRTEAMKIPHAKVRCAKEHERRHHGREPEPNRDRDHTNVHDHAQKNRCTKR